MLPWQLGFSILPWLHPCSYTPLTTPLFLYSPHNSPVPLLPDYTPVPTLLWLHPYSYNSLSSPLVNCSHSQFPPCFFTPLNTFLFLYSPISIIPWLHPPVPILPWLHTPVPILPYFYNSLTTPPCYINPLFLQFPDYTPVPIIPYLYTPLTTPLVNCSPSLYPSGGTCPRRLRVWPEMDQGGGIIVKGRGVLKIGGGGAWGRG